MTFWTAFPARAWRGAAVFAVLVPAALAAQSQNGILVGRVLSGDVAVPHASITASGGRVTIARVDGRFRMILPAGRYSVRAARIGFASASDTITVTVGSTATLNFRLERSPSSLEAVAAVGSHGFERSAIDAPDPIDVIEGVQLRSTGRTTTSQALQAFSASIVTSHAGSGQATDLVHPFSMRGLDPDHVLVLVNGKRRHQSALVNLNRTPGRGTSGVDLDAIPLSLIDHVEILHGDAVSQFGSDAIAGVVNVVLKSGVHGFAASTVGESRTTYNRDAGSTPGSISANDGQTLQASIDKGVVFGEGGFLHGGFELRDHGRTNRAFSDAGLPTSAAPQFGDPHSHDVALVLNGGNLLANGLELYGNATGARRTTNGQGAQYFAPLAAPQIRSTNQDYDGTIGVRGQADDWRFDLSSVYGRNAVRLEYDSPATFDAGEQRLAEWTTNLDLNREFSYFEEVRVGLGAELRRDSYQTEPGSSSLTALIGQPIFATGGASSRARSSLGGHLDVEADLSPTLTLGLGGRLEHYEELGTLTAGKASLRFEPQRHLVFRGSLARGFRAPSLQQTSLDMLYFDPLIGSVELVPSIGGQLSPTLGTRLKAERSTDYAVGVAAELTPALSFTLDAYRTDLSDRVVLGEAFFVPPTLGQPVSTGALQSFVNGANTRTEGLDANLSYALRFESTATLRLSAGANLNHTALDEPTGNLSLSAIEQTRLTKGEPSTNFLGSAVFALHDFGAMLRVQRVGEVTGYESFASATEQVYAASWLTDVRASYTLIRKYTFSAGADNLFDVYPPRGTPSFVKQGISPYTTNSPFGFSGRFVYGRLSIYL